MCIRNVPGRDEYCFDLMLKAKASQQVDTNVILCVYDNSQNYHEYLQSGSTIKLFPVVGYSNRFRNRCNTTTQTTGKLPTLCGIELS